MQIWLYPERSVKLPVCKSSVLKKVDEGKGFIVKVSPSQTQTDDANKYGAFVIMLKRDVAIETDRDILKRQRLSLAMNTMVFTYTTLHEL